LVLANPFNLPFLRTLSADDNTGADHQTQTSSFGTSGGNINDISTLYCCSGTLGSLVTDGTTRYILSNNHVLARTNGATVGEDISQPGLVDNFCQSPRIVADLSAFPLLSTNVDAAIAELRSNTMATDGSILDIGTPSSVVQGPFVGLAVQKSGRTTGHTTGVISSVSTDVRVQYQPRCGMGKKLMASFTDQIVISSNTFSAGGDSGALIVTNDTWTQPVALLFAGSSTTTIGNPIGEVLTKVGDKLGRGITFVGDSSKSSPPLRTSAQSTSQSVQQAHAAKERWADEFMNRPGVIGVGVGTSEDGSEAAVVVYVDNTAPGRPNLPDRADRARVRVAFTDPFVSR
jgi:hypothetical protein